MAENQIVRSNGMPPEGINPLTVLPQDGDTASLPTAIQEWRRVNDEIAGFKQQIRERTRKAKALESFIMGIMKRHNIGALDLKTSNGRVLYKRGKRAGALGAKKQTQLIADYMKSEQKATELMKFLAEHRETKTSERLTYEAFD